MNLNTARAALLASAATLFAFAATAAESITVKLAEPGAEPRSVLAFKPAKDSEQFARYIIKTQIEMDPGTGATMKMGTPIIEIELGSLVKDVSAEGLIRTEDTLHRTKVSAGPGTNPQTVAMLSQGYSQMEGLKSGAEIKPNGEKSESVIGDNPVGAGGVGDMTSSLMIVFPSEPVGVGGKWTVVAPMDRQGLKMDMNLAFELVRVEGDSVGLKMSLEGKAAQQNLQLPNLPPGATAELQQASMSGTGEIELNLARINPVKAIQKVASETSMKISGASPEPMTMKQNSKMEITCEEIKELSPPAQAAGAPPASAAPSAPPAGAADPAPKPAAPKKNRRPRAPGAAPK